MQHAVRGGVVEIVAAALRLEREAAHAVAEQPVFSSSTENAADGSSAVT
jgi:hypothetical protein